MKLIELNTDHYVVVDDSEIKEGDWYLTFGNNEVIGEPRKCEDSTYSFFHCKKITHSTQPIEDFTRADGTTIKVYVQVKSLYLYEVKELLGVVDVEKKAEKAFPIISGGHPNINWDRANLQEGFVAGYNQALEDNKEKKYTEEDIRKVILVEMARKYLSDVAAFEIDEIIQSLQPKTEWGVEFIDGKLRLK